MIQVKWHANAKRPGRPFLCVPSVFAEIDPWWDRQPPGCSQFKPDVTGQEVIFIDLEPEPSGVLLVNSLLTHGARPNCSEDEFLRWQRLRTWAERTHPLGGVIPGDTRGSDRKNFATAALNLATDGPGRDP